MNLLEPYNVSSIDFNDIIFKPPKIIKNKKIIFLKYNNKKNSNFVIQLSNLANNYVIDSNEIEFEIKNTKVIDFLNNLDNFIIEQTKTKINEWFNHIDDLSSIDYQRIINGENIIKLKILNNDSFKTKVTLNDEEIDDFNEIDGNVSAKAIVEVYAIWIKNNSFGLLLRTIKIGISQTVYNYKFLESDDEEKESENIVFIKNNNLNINEEPLTLTTDTSNDLNKIILG
jgi:hypothetical protein